jgi:hypothetical protein
MFNLSPVPRPVKPALPDCQPPRLLARPGHGCHSHVILNTKTESLREFLRRIYGEPHSFPAEKRAAGRGVSSAVQRLSE